MKTKKCIDPPVRWDCPGKDGKGCPTDYFSENGLPSEIKKHEQHCGGPGGGGARAGAGSGGGGKRERAGKKKEGGLHGIRAVRANHNIPTMATHNDDGTCFCVSHCFCDNCPPQKREEARHGCAGLATRYVGATNVVMSMDHVEEEMKVLIDTCIRVNDSTKDRLQTEWETEHMAHGMPLPACAACGIRNPHHARQYVRWKLSSLPPCFHLSLEDTARVASLGTTEIFNSKMQPVVVDIKKLVSRFFKANTNQWYHLHSEQIGLRANSP
jgi:hypothetical protein